jgi:hypothetical protein
MVILPLAAGGSVTPMPLAEPLTPPTKAEIVPVDAEFTDLSPSNRSPETVLAEAKRAATALQEVIESKPNKVVINGKTYLTFEDWQTVGRFYNLTAKVVDSKPVNLPGVAGWEARAVVVDNRTGMEVSGADAMCLDDEKRCDKAPSYQLRSMAQTRACSKALRNVLAFVPVLAGLQPTPAEEMTS